MWKWLGKVPPPSKPGMPDPRKEKSLQKATMISAANAEVEAAMKEKSELKKKRGTYHTYTSEEKANIGKYAAENGNKAALKKFETLLNFKINESTIRTFKKAYLTAKNIAKDDNVISLESKRRGRPLMLGDKLDKKVLDYVKATRNAGGIINRNIIIAAAIGIIKHENRALLKEYGGPLEITIHYATYVMERLNFVKRKGTKAARNLPPDFAELKVEFLNRISEAVQQEAIPKDLVINFDQTGLKIVPVSNWTMAEQGKKQIEIVGLTDKREITAVLAVTLTGKMLPLQVIYTGKTDSCHPHFNFPEDFDITHTSNHWSNELSMQAYIKNILVPFVEFTKSTLDLPKEQKAVIICDVFAAHRCSSVIKEFENFGLIPIFVPPGCTGELQPLDLTVNEHFKTELKSLFSSWYANEVQKSLDNVETNAIENVKIDLRLSLLKPLHA